MKDYIIIAKKIAKDYFQENDANILGVIFIGSLSFGIEDELSDMDIRIIVKEKINNFKMLQFKFEGLSIEIDQMEWDWLTNDGDDAMEKDWIRKKGIILFDKENALQKTFKRLNKTSDRKYKEILWKNFKETFNSYDISKSIKRKDYITAEMYINRTINYVAKFIFIYNNLPVPTFKWRWYFIRKLNLFDINKVELLLDRGHTLEERLNKIKALENDLAKMMIDKGFDKKKVENNWMF
jgi:hypothetical protein